MGFFKKLLVERSKIGGHKTDILVIDRATGKPLQHVKNKVIMPGSAFTAAKHFNIEECVKLPTYNSKMNLDDSVSGPAQNTKCICLFSVGTDGAGAESSQMIEPDYKKWCPPDYLVPFRYVSSDISDDEKKTYAGKKTNNNGTIAYYFKSFTTDPVMFMQFTDGTPVDENLYTSTNSLEAETFMEINLTISQEDCREYFRAVSSLSSAKINTISLLAAWYTEDSNGIKTFQDIIPITKLNIHEELLTDLTKGLDFVYHIYY